MNRSNVFLYLVVIALLIALVAFSSFVNFEGFNWNNLVMIPIFFGIIYFFRTFANEIIYNKVNEKLEVVEQKYRLHMLLKKNDSKLDEIETYIIKQEDIKSARRIRSILIRNNIKIGSIKETQEIIENGEIENFTSQIVDKQSNKEIKNILKWYGTEDVGFMKLRIKYETQALLKSEKSFSLTSGAFSILSLLFGFYVIQDIWSLICVNWINCLIVAIFLIIDTIITYNKVNSQTYEHYAKWYNEIQKYIDIIDKE